MARVAGRAPRRGPVAAGYDITVTHVATGAGAWASGAVAVQAAADASNHPRAAVRATVGTPLAEGTLYEWTVRWQDAEGRWSPPASPSMSEPI